MPLMDMLLNVGRWQGESLTMKNWINLSVVIFGRYSEGFTLKPIEAILEGARKHSREGRLRRFHGKISGDRERDRSWLVLGFSNFTNLQQYPLSTPTVFFL
jgi:hypothetical protein